MEYHSYEDRANWKFERAMELVFIQVDNVQDELEQLALLVDEIKDDALREKMDNMVIKAMTALSSI